MKILTAWLRTYLPSLPVTDRELADDLTLRGIAVEGVHDLGPGNGCLFEMDITTNRVDAMNHYGIAREAATIYNLALPPLLDDPANIPTAAGLSPAVFGIRIEAPELCGRFTARVLRGVTVAASTGQVKTFFDLLGQKQISNAVDASNFTLLGMGHPTHAFDLDKIDGAIVVRLARKGEKLRLLDGTERTLEPDDLVIADESKALSLAGVMGGYDSMITAETRNIVVESAWFDPATIRRSSRRHLLHTDASHRFERGADLNAVPVASELVSRLILQSGGHAEGPLHDVVTPSVAARTSSRPPVTLSVSDVQRHLGVTLDDTPSHSSLTSGLVQQYLAALGCTLHPTSHANTTRAILHARQDTTSDATFSVALPSWRLDLERPIDLIEEVARVFGYNRFANTLPPPRPVLVHPSHAPHQAVRNRLLALGFSEAISSTFASAPDTHLFSPASIRQGSDAHPTAVVMENPLSEDASNLRPSLLPGMLTMLANNLNRDVPSARLFEQGHIFKAAGSTGNHIGEVHELPGLSLGLTSAVAQTTNLYSPADAPIFELKGAIQSIASLFTLPNGADALTFTTANPPSWLHPGRSATALLGSHPIARFGELSPAESSRRKLRQPVFLAELDLAALYAHPLRKVTAHELSRFQAAQRDFSFVFPDSVLWHTVSSSIRALSIPELQQLSPVEVWRDQKKYPGVYSLLIRTVFQPPSRTLTDDELTSASDRIIEALTRLGGVHRA